MIGSESMQLAGLPLRLLHMSNNENSAEFTSYVYDVPADAPIFDVHFPGHPVLPGAVIIGLAVRAVTDAYPDYRVHLTAARLIAPALPGNRLMFVFPCTSIGDQFSVNVTVGSVAIAKVRFDISDSKKGII